MTGFGPLRSVEGAPLKGKNVDAEGVALAPTARSMSASRATTASGAIPT